MTYINLIKLSVGTNSTDDLQMWQASTALKLPNNLPRHVTRMWPKRGDEILNGGSIYWVIKGWLSARQQIIGMDEVFRNDGVRCCALILDAQIHLTETVRRRPFQGWRYLKPEESPKDLSQQEKGDDILPPELLVALADIGVR
ncbi:MAG: DUF1489 domain-containing protein [Proteobacteria bacterium]|jgi:hypothetical protein|nr:DUF1489 domain-containing protein [Pseudomonadota bacterium]MDA1238140.1 DUF1489 domain-containing protein [Pseudomonadota bacterium]